ncbi:MAG: hypothetical protein IPN76_14915 [Saprospiraceae bacterium]|nr:hypothetical protein [Saprospiraceae bacterium]
MKFGLMNNKCKSKEIAQIEGGTTLKPAPENFFWAAAAAAQKEENLGAFRPKPPVR